MSVFYSTYAACRLVKSQRLFFSDINLFCSV